MLPMQIANPLVSKKKLLRAWRETLMFLNPFVILEPTNNSQFSKPIYLARTSFDPERAISGSGGELGVTIAARGNA
jgi:hypothetical protein